MITLALGVTSRTPPMNAEVIVIESEKDSVSKYRCSKPCNNPPPQFIPTNVSGKARSTPYTYNYSRNQYHKDQSPVNCEPVGKSTAPKQTASAVGQGLYAPAYLQVLGDEQGIRRSVMEKRREMDNLIKKENNFRKASELATSTAENLTVELTENEEEMHFFRISLAAEFSNACIDREYVDLSQKLTVLENKRSIVRALRQKRDRQRFLALENSKKAIEFEESSRKCKKQLTSLLIMLNAAHSLDDDVDDSCSRFACKQQPVPAIATERKESTQIPQQKEESEKITLRSKVEENVIDSGDGSEILKKVRKRTIKKSGRTRTGKNKSLQ